MKPKVNSVRAKFQCNEVLETVGSKTARLSAVTFENQGNEDFTSYTPGGSLEIVISDTAKAAAFFEIGRQYYLDFTPAQ